MTKTKTLPQFCYTLLNTTGELIRIERGQKGYMSYSDDKPENKGKKILGLDALDRAEKLNAALGISDICIVEAMSVGSMFGWNIPGADPEMFKGKEDKLRENLMEIAERSEKLKGKI